MDEFGICADSYQFCTKGLKILMLLCQSSKFGCSDKGEIGRIEEQHCPLLICLQFSKAD